MTRVTSLPYDYTTPAKRGCKPKLSEPSGTHLKNRGYPARIAVKYLLDVKFSDRKMLLEQKTMKQELDFQDELVLAEGCEELLTSH